MPLWSLTQERVERLRKQIGDQELEVDALVLKSKEDLWKTDLEDFINEWRFQLDDEAKRQKKARSLGRRASQKLKIGGAGPKKRKAIGYGSDDSDFGVSRAKKPAATKPLKAKAGGLLTEPLAKANQPQAKRPKLKAAPEVKPEKQPDDDKWMDLGRADKATAEVPIAPIFQKTKAAAAANKPFAPAKIAISDDDDDEDDEVILKPAVRKPRAAASKPVTYGLESNSDDSGDAMLFDVGKMVKGINGASTDSNSRPLFSATTSTSRPGSSHGLPKKPTSGLARQTEFDAADDTDYSKLAPPTTKKGPAVTARHTVLSDEEDDSFDAMMTAAPTKPAPPKAAAKNGVSRSTKIEISKASKPPAPKNTTSKAPAVKKAAPAAGAAPPKKLPLSPAAKAYAAKQAKKNKVIHDDSSEEEDEVEKVANEIMEEDDDDDDLPVARRPARAAATAPKKNWVVASGSEDEEDESAMFEAEDSDDY